MFVFYSYFDVFGLESNTGFRHFDFFLVENQIPVSAAHLWLLPVQVRYVARPLIALSCCAVVILQCCGWI